MWRSSLTNAEEQFLKVSPRAHHAVIVPTDRSTLTVKMFDIIMQRFLSPELMDDALQCVTKLQIIIAFVPGLFFASVLTICPCQFLSNCLRERCILGLYALRSIRDQGIADSGLSGAMKGPLAASPANSPPPLCVLARGGLTLDLTKHNMFSTLFDDAAKRHTSEHRAGAKVSRCV